MKNEALIKNPRSLNAFTEVLQRRLTDGTDRPVLVTLRNSTVIQIYWDDINKVFLDGTWSYCWNADGSCSYKMSYPGVAMSNHDMIECND